MSGLEAYLFLFFDSFMAVLVGVPNTHMAFQVMRMVGGYNVTLMIFVAIIGDVLGSSCNYAFGHILNYVKTNIADSKPSIKFLALKKMANDRLFILVALSFIPLFGIIITTLAGFLRVSYSRFFIALLVGRVGYYLVISFLMS